MIKFILGDVALLQDRALARTRKEQGGRQADSFFGPEAKARAIVEACSHLSLLGESPFVLLRAADRLPKKEHAALLDYIPRVPEDVCLVLMADKVDRRLKFWQQIIKASDLISVEAPPPRECGAWIGQECRRRALKVAPDAMSLLAETAQMGMNEALMLLDKVELFLGDKKELNRESLESCRSGGSPGKIFEWAEAVGARDFKRALSLLQNLWSHQESPLALLALLVRHFRILMKAVENKQQWRNRQQMASVLGVPPFVVERYLKQAGTYSRAQLLMIWNLLLTTDRRLKSSPSRKTWELEQLVWDLKSKAL